MKTLTKDQYQKIVDAIYNEAEKMAKKEKILTNRTEELAFIIGWMKGQIISMLENGNEETILKYYKS